MPTRSLTPSQVRQIILLGKGQVEGEGDEPLSSSEELTAKVVLNLKYELQEPALSCALYYPESILSKALLEEIGFSSAGEEAEESAPVVEPVLAQPPAPEAYVSSPALEEEPDVEADDEEEDDEADDEEESEA